MTDSLIRAMRWQDAVIDGSSYFVLVTRYRPRIAETAETWNHWDRRLAPSAPLLRAAKHEGMPWDAYAKHFADEMQGEAATDAIAEYADRARTSHATTFLCFCSNPAKCHRTIVADLVRVHAQRLQ